jgi:hypothetical protein
MEARVAVLEHIAATTLATLERVERRIDGLETGMRADLRQIQSDARADFRWLLGIMLGGFAGLLGVMAHGFHWL